MGRDTEGEGETLPPAVTAELRAHARRIAPEVWEAACTDAQAEVRHRLRDVLVPLLLDELVAPGGQRPSIPDGAAEHDGESVEVAAPGTDPTADGLGWYVFGVVDRAVPSSLLPDDVETVEQGGMAALAQQVPLADFPRDARALESAEDLQWLEQYARLHDQVVNAALEGGAVLPLRFGTVVGGREDVRTLLRRHGDVFRSWLDRLDGRAEFTVKAWVDQSAVAAQVDSLQQAGSDGTGTAYLQQRQAERTRKEQARHMVGEVVEDVHARLAAAAEDATTVPTRPDAPLPRPDHHGAYLVAASQRDELATTVEALATEHRGRGLQLDFAGPWPAHHFLPESWEEA